MGGPGENNAAYREKKLLTPGALGWMRARALGGMLAASAAGVAVGCKAHSYFGNSLWLYFLVIMRTLRDGSMAGKRQRLMK